MYLFVYGTLKHGHGLNQYLTQNGATYKGWASCKGLRLYNWGACPGAYPHEESVIWGEVYEIDATILAKVDGLESLYTREPREVMITEGAVDLNPVTAWVYLSNLNPVGGEWIADGLFNISNLRVL